MSEVVAAVASLAAVIIALLTLLREMVNARRVREEVQVRRVSAWLEATPQGRDLVVRNDSDAPIYAVQTSEHSVRPFEEVASFVLPAGEERVRSFMHNAVGCEKRHSYAIRFIDAAGIHWKWWGAEGIPGEPSGKDFEGKPFERIRSG